MGCRDTAPGVAIGKPHYGLKWCCDTVFDVARRFGPFGVATQFLVSRHGLASRGSRPGFGVATKPGHGGGSWCRGMGLVSRQGQVVGGVVRWARTSRYNDTVLSVRYNERIVRALYMRPTCYSTPCCALFWVTVWNTVLGHCS